MSTWVKGSTLTSPDGSVAVTPRQGGGYALSTLGPGITSSTLQPIWWLKGDYGLTAGSTWLNAGTAGGSATCPATSTAATVNGLPALGLATNATTVTLPNVAFVNAPRAIFAVIKLTQALATNNTAVFVGPATTTPSISFCSGLTIIPSTSYNSIYPYMARYGAVSGTVGVLTNNLVTGVQCAYPYANFMNNTSTPNLVGCVYTAAASSGLAYINGVQIPCTSTVYDTPPSYLTAPIPYAFPSPTTFTTIATSMNLCELQMYDGLMSQSQAASIVAGLVAKWGVVA